jgi:hypothetical protein
MRISGMTKIRQNVLGNVLRVYDFEACLTSLTLSRCHLSTYFRIGLVPLRLLINYA